MDATPETASIVLQYLLQVRDSAIIIIIVIIIIIIISITITAQRLDTRLEYVSTQYCCTQVPFCSTKITSQYAGAVSKNSHQR